MLPPVVMQDCSADPLNWSQMDQLRGKGFPASAILTLNLTRGEAMALLVALSFKDFRPKQTCTCCHKAWAPGRGRLEADTFTCYHCLILRGWLSD